MSQAWTAASWQHAYAAHLEQISAAAQARLAEAELPGVVLHAGSPLNHHADDQGPPFRALPHFARFVPLGSPEHLLLLPAEGSPRLLQVCPRDFWHQAPTAPPLDFSQSLATEAFATPRLARERARELGLEGWAYLGSSAACAEALGIPAAAREPEALLSRLDWDRAYKTPYEVACIREATRKAGLGHAAVAEGFKQGLSERALHFRYLEASGQLEPELPYGNIIAWDAHGAVLHYTARESQPPSPGQVLLIDAGATHLGYASDITRTHTGPATHPVFQELSLGLQALQERWVQGVAPGVDYVDLHRQSYQALAELLIELKILSAPLERVREEALAFSFYPHGLGHHLGLQVHDVGGKQKDPTGGLVPPPEDMPWLRTTRRLEEGQVVTIEPGAYFIPLLLDPLREGEHKDAFNWELIDALIPLGGIRVEDDVLVTAAGRENLSRPFVPV